MPGGSARYRLPAWTAAVVSRLWRLSAIILLAGFFGASLVRMAPGFGADERMLDPRLSRSSIEAIARERSQGRNILAYYAAYLRRLGRGDLGTSLSLNRPVKELVIERAGVSLHSCGAGLAMAWGGAAGLTLLLEWFPRGAWEAAASFAAGALLCVPAAILAVLCFLAGGLPSLAIAAILFPRIFCYTRNLVHQSRGSPHVFLAEALGEGRGRILLFHVIAPVLPELFALAGISFSIAAGVAIPVEAVFDSPGVGQLVWQAALARDLPVIVNVTLLLTVITAGANLAADLARGVREPVECSA